MFRKKRIFVPARLDKSGGLYYNEGSFFRPRRYFMKRIGLLLCLFLLLPILFACGGSDAASPSADTPSQTERPADHSDRGSERPADTEQSPPYTVTVTCDLPEGVTLTGGALCQTVTSAAEFEPVELMISIAAVKSTTGIPRFKTSSRSVLIISAPE